MTTMSVTDLCRLGIDVLSAKAKAGEIGPREFWTALRGAAKYREAVARGDVATGCRADQRMSVCLTCPSRTCEPTSVAGVVAGFCGEAFEETATTCGCLVTVTIDGNPWPAGKPVVSSECCPQDRWEPN
jgi:hypothetical protein